MNTVVNKLLDVDKQARQILDEAQQYYDRTISDIETEKQKITAEYENKAKSHYDEIGETEGDNIEDATKEIEEKYARLTKEMDETFESGHTRWEDELYNRCISAATGDGGGR